MNCAFGIKSKSLKIFNCFFPKSFIVACFTFKFTIHFNFCKRYETQVKVYFLPQDVQHHLLKSQSFLHSLLYLCQKSVEHIYMVYFWVLYSIILTHESVPLPVLCSLVFSSCMMSWTQDRSVDCPPTLLLFFKIVVAILVPILVNLP